MIFKKLPKLKGLFISFIKGMIWKNGRFQFVLKDKEGKQAFQKYVRGVNSFFSDVLVWLCVFASFSTVVSSSDSDMLHFRFRPEFPAAGARVTDSFQFEHFVILKYFFFSIEIKSFVTLRKIWYNNIVHNSLFGNWQFNDSTLLYHGNSFTIL